MGFFSIFSKEKKQELDQGLQKSKESFFAKLAKSVVGKSKVDDDVLDNLEEVLVTSDVGVETTLRIIERIEARVSRDKYIGTEQLNTILKEEIAGLLLENDLEKVNDFVVPEMDTPYIILVVGVNGVGKTTTIGKLAYQFKKKGYNVMLGAADTFRAAAIEQLEEWAKRADVPIVTQKMGADPAAVAYDTVASAIARKSDVVLIDTAGRLHNKTNLMNELNKIDRVIKRECPYCSKETLLVLDATTGQNGLIQAKQFKESCGITGIVLTKLDGTAKGGIAIAIAQELGLPVKFAGVGEGMDDLRYFDADEFVKAFI